MKLDDNVRRCVCFVGHAEMDNEETFKAVGSAFFVNFGGFRYIVTAKHIADAFGDSPFAIRINRKDGGSDVVHHDPLADDRISWLTHADGSVDLAVLGWPFADAEMDMLQIKANLLLTDEAAAAAGVEPGSLCYAVGLFRLLQGTKRNVPVIHTGHIALLPSDELIPVKYGNERRFTRAYLVELQNLSGLSGSPVLVRPSIDTIGQRLVIEETGPRAGRAAALSSYSADVHVLGVWASSWEGLPDGTLAMERGDALRVPVGLGAVTPAGRLIEILEGKEAADQRQRWEGAIALREINSAGDDPTTQID